MPQVESSPSSPPELTGSQSSKSSSYTSRISSDEHNSNNMHFEEIHLDDEHHRESDESKTNRRKNQGIVNPSRLLSQRPPLATLQTHQTQNLRSVDGGTKSAATPSFKRHFTSPVTSLNPQKHPHRTRSESPALHKSRSTSRLGPFASTPATSLAIPNRRGSWQPSRKTIYEIEAEYHDSDDELPDDASLFNVPVSPYLHRSRATSARSSAQGSPERDSPATSPGPIPLGHARTAPDPSPRPRGSTRTIPRHRLGSKSSSSQAAKSKSASTSPQADTRSARTKSWNLVMADLDHESRIIAEKLDFHHEAHTKINATASTSYRSSAPGAIPLPPIQRGTLDFMPVSKEKEAVLSRTRPSWLPPKDPREEKRHLDEYKKMMRASIEADKKREGNSKLQPSADDDTRQSLHRIWTYYVDPTTDVDSIDKRVNDLCWRGIPSKLRGAVWQRRIGNPLNLSLDSYATVATRVAEIKSKPIERLTEREKIMQEWYADIERDAETALPDIGLFQKHGPQWQDLIDVCEAYATYRSEIGYVYGMQLVAALILVQLPSPDEAFVLLANCLNKQMPLEFQTGDSAATSRTYGKVKSTLDIKFPRLHDYLFNDQDSGGLGFTGDELFEHMFSTIFANGLGIEMLCRVWDIWIFESDRYLVRTAVALLGALQSQIFDIQGDVHLRRRNIQEMLAWGPFNRTASGYWNLNGLGGVEAVVEEIQAAGRLDCAGR